MSLSVFTIKKGQEFGERDALLDLMMHTVHMFKIPCYLINI